MTMLKLIRYGAWAALALLLFVTGAVLIGWWQVDGPGGGRMTQQGAPAVGGPFSLVDHRGKPVTEADFKGRPAAVFFGFTYCPEVCPTTLFDLSTRMKELGPAADRLQVLFITVDPERDTPQQLATYLESFDPRITGLSGTQAQVEAALAAYKAYAKCIPTEGSYTMDHTASVYLMNADGSFRTLIDYHEDAAAALAKLKRLLG